MPDFDELITLSDGRRISIDDLIRERMSGSVARSADEDPMLAITAIPGRTAPATVSQDTAFADNALKYLNNDIRAQAKAEYRKEMNFDKKGFWGRVQQIIPTFNEVFTAAGNPGYKGREQQIYQQKLADFKDIAPMFQRDAAAQETADVRRQVAETTREKNWQTFVNAAEANGIKRATLEANKPKIQAQIGLLGEQQTFTRLKAEQQKLDTAEQTKTGFKPGVEPTSLIEARAGLDPEQRKGHALWSLAGGAGRLLNQGGTGAGASTTRTTFGSMDATDPNTGMTIKVPNPIPNVSTFTRGGAGQKNPLDNPFTKMLFGELTVDSPAYKIAQSAMGTPATPPPPPSVKKAISAAAPVGGPGITSKPQESFWQPVPQGRMPEAVQNRHRGRNSAIESSRRAFTSLNSEVPEINKILTRFGPINQNEHMLNFRRVLDKINFDEANIRQALNSQYVVELRDFTGKQANEKDRTVIDAVIPTPRDGKMELLSKMILTRLLTEYEITLRGNPMSGRASINPVRHRDFDPGRLVIQSKRLVQKLAAGKAITDNDFNIQSLYRDIFDKYEALK